MTASFVKASLASFVVLIASINFVGIDPADIALVVVLPILCFGRWHSLLLQQLEMRARICLFVFIGCYLLSLVINPFNTSFVLNFLSNVAFFYCIYFLTTSVKRRANFSNLLVIGFFSTNVLELLIMVGPWPEQSFLFEAVRDARYNGPLGDPNLQALYAILTSLILIDELVLARNMQLSKTLKGLLLLGSIFVLFGTQSRSAWLAFVVCIPAYFVLVRRNFDVWRLAYALLLIAALGALIFAALSLSDQTQLVNDRLQSLSEHDSEAEEDRFKLVFTAAAILVAVQNPLGAGPGMSITATGIENTDGNPIGAHNAFVQIFADNGWGAIAILLLLLVMVMRRVYKNALLGLNFCGISCRILVCGVLATCIMGMFHDLLSWRIAWIFPALAMLSCCLKRPPFGHRSRLALNQ